MIDKIGVFWFRQDLRLSDNPGLTEASKDGSVLPIYLLDDESPAEFKMGSASRWWLHHSLNNLNQSLDGKLNVYVGSAKEVLLNIIKTNNVRAVYWNRCYEPWRIHDDAEIKAELTSLGIECKTFNGSLLWEPWEVTKKDNTPYKVYTPYFRNGCSQAKSPRIPLPKPENIKLIKDGKSQTINDLNLLPTIPWDKKMEPCWEIGESAAQKKLEAFLDDGLPGYKENRNYPAKPNVSRLSPHLHFGEISPNQVWYSAQAHGLIQGVENDLDCFLSELGWREFSYYLLYHFPELPRKNFQSKFDHFPWQYNIDLLKAWQHGQTGYPIVDAGMRQLWQTGYMHNRLRMIVASFLVKNLLLNWHHGEDWFWDCLVDADLANNSASWQWVAGSGADAAPYFRIFNPVLQGEKFDPNGAYTRHFVPELKNIPNKYLFSPWKAPEHVLKASGVTLGTTYPKPIIDLEKSRNRALEAFKMCKNL
ncbi:MAG: deoxyribodipyrimidine photo-lyase [Pseudomonadota bacterium]